ERTIDGPGEDSRCPGRQLALGHALRGAGDDAAEQRADRLAAGAGQRSGHAAEDGADDGKGCRSAQRPEEDARALVHVLIMPDKSALWFSVSVGWGASARPTTPWWASQTRPTLHPRGQPICHQVPRCSLISDPPATKTPARHARKGAAVDKMIAV